MMNFIFRGKFVLTDTGLGKKGLLDDSAVYVQNDTIKEIGKYQEIIQKYPDAPVKGNGKQILMPGLIDAHSHGSGLTPFQRGVKYDFLENYLIDSTGGFLLEPELNALMCGIRHLKKGCTTVHAIYNHINTDIARKTLRGFKKAGIRLAYSSGVNDKNKITYDDEEFYKTLPAELQEKVHNIIFNDKKAFRDGFFEHFDDLYSKYNDDMSQIIFGPLWVQGCSDEFLMSIKKKSSELGDIPIHIHTLQTPLQKAYGLKKYNKSLAFHLDDIGLIDKNIVLGHAVFLDQSDIELLAEKNGSVTHHASCNLVVRNGISPVALFVKAGINVALGIDDKSINDDEDPFMEMRMIYHLQRVAGFDLENTPTLSSIDVLNMPIINGARVCNLENKIGAIKPGMKADMLLLDLERISQQPWVSPKHDIFDLIISRAKGDDVNTVIVNGEIVIENYKFCQIDLDEVYNEVQNQVKSGNNHGNKKYAELLQELKPYIRSFYQKWDLPKLVPFYNMNSRI